MRFLINGATKTSDILQSVSSSVHFLLPDLMPCLTHHSANFQLSATKCPPSMLSEDEERFDQKVLGISNLKVLLADFSNM